MGTTGGGPADARGGLSRSALGAPRLSAVTRSRISRRPQSRAGRRRGSRVGDLDPRLRLFLGHQLRVAVPAVDVTVAADVIAHTLEPVLEIDLPGIRLA